MGTVAVSGAVGLVALLAAQIPTGPAPEPLPNPHLPDRLHAFVFRNWDLVNVDRMAQVLRADPGDIVRIGRSMGLPEKRDVTDEEWRRSYITIIRRNWHLLPYEQLTALLGWDEARLAYTLREDDFLWVKLGSLKPRCEVLRYVEPDEDTRSRAAWVKEVIREAFGPALLDAGEGRFAFVRAWEHFSRAFAEYPFCIDLVYRAPVQVGPANPLYPRETGYRSTMVGIPYDDLGGWRGVYPPEVMAEQFEKVAGGWREGIRILTDAVERVPPGGRRGRIARRDLGVAEAAYLHFRSVANQVRFLLARSGLKGAKGAGEARSRMLGAAKAMEAMGRIARDEMALARRLYSLAREDSRIGFEATNHYFYVPLDLVEKVVHCRWIIDRWIPEEMERIKKR